MNQAGNIKGAYTMVQRIPKVLNYRQLAGGQVFLFLGDFPFSSHLTIDSAQNE